MPHPPHEDEPPHESHQEPPHGPPPEHHHPDPVGEQWIINEERWRDINEIGEFLESVGSELKSAGRTEMGGQVIEPASNSLFVVRYERLPEGELKLHFEVEWDPRLGQNQHDIVDSKNEDGNE